MAFPESKGVANVNKKNAQYLSNVFYELDQQFSGGSIVGKRGRVEKTYK